MTRVLAALLIAIAPLGSATALAAAPAAAKSDAEAAFRQLSALVGVWRIAAQPHSPLRIRFYPTAGGTTLVESWERAGKPHSLTLYHLDGERLIATHYCPQGNQPRLALVTRSPHLRFPFRDATGLDPGESHLHDLAFDLRDPARVGRSEIYRSGTKVEPSALVLVREPA